jgi:cysteinyl-tRNA synthetase
VKPFQIYNSLHRAVEEFVPLKPGIVTFYSCGPTVYLPQHLGNMRAYVFVDTLRRALRFNGYDVRHVMNITDVGHMTSDADAGEDKIEKTARAQGKSPREVADFYIAQFKRDCAALNIELPPDAPAGDHPTPPQSALCRATDNIDAMIAVIGRIVANGYGYVTPSGVYFDVEKWRGPGGIGRLARQSLTDQYASQRLEHSPDKKSPHDFALWVLNQPNHLMQWDSPWGRGYPGWHIECSAMSMKYLGETLDIHSGGLDHIPVHHENEIAQSESATGHPFARYFVHNAFLVGMEGAKISKSAGRFPVLDDLVAAGINPLAFRVLCLGAKYRSELAFSLDSVRAAQKNLDYLNEFAFNLNESALTSNRDADWATEYSERFHEALNNDLNTPQALAVILEMVAQAYRLHDQRIWKTLQRFDQVFGLNLAKRREETYMGLTPPEIHRLVNEREEARRRKDFARSDELRIQLDAMGYIVKDTKTGPTVTPKRNAT